MACVDDFDCPGFQLCYENTTVSWLDESECLCNTEYGFGGVDCTNFGPATYYGVITLSLLGVVDFIGLGFALFMIFRLVRGKELKLNSMGVTLLLLTTAFAIQFVRDVILITIYFTPNLQTIKLLIAGDTIEKGHILIFAIRILVGVEVLLSFTCALNVSLLWVEIASKSKNFRRNTGELLNNYRRAILVVELLLLIALFTAVGLGNYTLISFIVMPILVIAALSFVYGQRRIGALLSDTTANGMKYQTIARNIKYCANSIFVLVMMLLGFVVGAGLLAQRGYKESTPKGQVSAYNFVNIGVYYIVTVLAYVILIYVYSQMKQAIARSGSKTQTSSQGGASPITPRGHGTGKTHSNFSYSI